MATRRSEIRSLVGLSLRGPDYIGPPFSHTSPDPARPTFVGSRLQAIRDDRSCNSDPSAGSLLHNVIPLAANDASADAVADRPRPISRRHRSRLTHMGHHRRSGERSATAAQRMPVIHPLGMDQLMSNISTQAFAPHLIAHQTTSRRSDPALTGASVAALLAPLMTACEGPVDAPARLGAALAILDTSAKLLAHTAPTALKNAPGAAPLAVMDPTGPGITDAVIAGAVATHFGEILGAAAVRLPLPNFLTLLPALRGSLRDTIEERLGVDRELDPRQVIGLVHRLAQAIADGEADTAHQAVWVLREVLTRSLPPQPTAVRQRTAPTAKVEPKHGPAKPRSVRLKRA